MLASHSFLREVHFTRPEGKEEEREERREEEGRKEDTALKIAGHFSAGEKRQIAAEHATTYSKREREREREVERISGWKKEALCSEFEFHLSSGG